MRDDGCVEHVAKRQRCSLNIGPELQFDEHGPKVVRVRKGFRVERATPAAPALLLLAIGSASDFDFGGDFEWRHILYFWQKNISFVLFDRTSRLLRQDVSSPPLCRHGPEL